MIILSILYYKNLRKDIEGTGFEMNPYDICAVHIMVKEKQQIITCNVDDVKSIHVDKKVNNGFNQWAEKTCGSNELRHLRVTRGKQQDCLDIILD